MFQTGSGRKIPGAAHPGEENDERKVQNGERELVNRCNTWAEGHMLMGAKEVLIKSVAQAIPTYTIGIFKLPRLLMRS
jgi:hypothetical protein